MENANAQAKMAARCICGLHLVDRPSVVMRFGNSSTAETNRSSVVVATSRGSVNSYCHYL